MAYKEYDNVELEDSGTSCPVPEIYNLVRNCGKPSNGDFYQQVLDADVSMDSTTNTGSGVLMFHNYADGDYNDYFTSGVIRNRDYVYMQVWDEACDVANHIDVLEYQISTGSTVRLTIDTFEHTIYGYTGYLQMAIIEDRKILAYGDFYHGRFGTAPNRYEKHYVFIADFEAQTVTKDLEWYGNYEHAVGSTPPEYGLLMGESILTIKMNNDDIWLYIIGMLYRTIGTYVVGGTFVYSKNYTQNSDWELVYIDAGEPPPNSGYESWIAGNPVITTDKKTIIIQSYNYPYDYSVYPPGYTGGMFYKFNTETQQITRSELCPGYGLETSRYAYDNQSGLVYFLDSSINPDWNVCINSYNPETNDFITEIYGWGYNAELVCTREHVYIITDIENKCYRVNGNNIPVFEGVLPLTTDTINDWQYAFVLDDEGPSLIWWDEVSNNTLYKTNINGTNITVYDSTGIVDEWWYGSKFNLGDCFVVVTGWWRNDIYYYLVK